ncbi:MAG: ISNCY family transposase [Actinomycetota bacterium]|nr:ISNCY family transposase [Actinomycetota bacterium]
MIVDRYDPINLFEMVPKLKLEFEPELAQLDELLDDDELFKLVKADLVKRYPNSGKLGRHSTPVEVILRMLVVKRLYGFSYEQTERFVCDSIVLRQFCRLYLESAPDDTTLIRWANTVGAETIEALNDRAVELARSLKVTRARKLRVDSTVVETNVHHPTDSRLLSDGVRVVSRLLRRAKKALDEDATRLGKEAFRTRNRSVRSLTKKLHRMALRKGEKAAEELQEAYRKLVRITRSSCAQAKLVSRALRDRTDSHSRRLADHLEHFLPLLERGIDQAVRRVLEGEQVPAKDKVLSLFEPHTMIITRRKVGKPREFGRKVLLDEVDGGIISRYEVLSEAGREHPHLPESIEGHRKRFGRAPDLLTGDRGLYSKEGEEAAKKAGIRRVALPQSGRPTKKRKEYEEQRWFKRAFAFRAGIEGRISVLRRGYALERCLYHGEEGMGRWVGWGILVHNLAKISKKQAARQGS